MFGYRILGKRREEAASGLQGQVEFTSNATWTPPAGVTSVSVVAVGGGGGGIYYNNNNSNFTYAMNGGGGGGLAWYNNAAVTPGTTYDITVGAGGLQGFFSTGSTAGGASSVSFLPTSSFVANGGAAGRYNATSSGGTYVGQGGGVGGASQNFQSSGIGSSGGGGAGGYSGNGGRGGTFASNRYPLSGSGGGGAGGGQPSSQVYRYSGSGGGVGIYGEGSSGIANRSQPGAGGSGGTDGIFSTSTSSPGSVGGLYGGGGGGSPSIFWGVGGDGGGGAVRIIWGAGRAFPSTNTADVTVIGGTGTVGVPTGLTFTLLDTITGNDSSVNTWTQKSYGASDGLTANSTGVLLIHMVVSSFRADMQVDDFNFGSGIIDFESSANNFQTTTVGTGLTTYLSTLSDAGKESTYNGLTFSNVITSSTNTSGIWNRDSGGTPSSNTGSTTDHTLGAGGDYLYFESSSSSHPIGGYLRSPSVTLGSTPSISFWTSRFGVNMGNAEVWWVT